MRDTLFQNPQGSFEFNEKVTQVFDDMINRSVPFYNHIQEQIVTLCTEFAQPHTSLYDLGCSTGTTLSQLSHLQNITRIGIDASLPMLKKAKQKCPDITFIQHDLNRPPLLTTASIVILNLCLQFITPENRFPLISEIYRQLLPGGILILIEKISPENQENQDLFEKIYHHFKFNQSYSKEEIIHKKKSLSNILIPFSSTQNKELLKNAGFSNYETIFQWYSFIGLFAVK